MNYFNHKNVQLAYEAVYNQDLCESMEDLGLIGEYDYLEEGENPYRTIRGASTNAAGQKVPWTVQATPAGHTLINGRRVPQSRVNPKASSIDKMKQRDAAKRSPKMEEVDLYDIILEYLIDEGYADTLGSAEIILENMSDEWIESIFEDRDGYGKDEKFYKPEHKHIPNKEWLIAAAKEKKTFGRPFGKYDPKKIKLQDILNQFPENRPGGRPKPRRVIPSRLDKR